MIKKLNDEIASWDKMEGASTVFFMYGWGKSPKINTEDPIKNENEDDDFRDDTQGNRNKKYLIKARIHADTPQAQLKRERTQAKKDLHG